MNIFYGYLATYSYLITILVIISLLKRKGKINENTSRKLIHIFVGFSWPIMVYFFKTSIHLIIPPLTFILINYSSFKKNLIKSMEKKGSKGTIYYALSFSLLAYFAVLNPKFLPSYGIGCLSLSLGDGLAPLFRYRFPNKKIGNTSKTYIGSFTVFIIAILISIIFNMIFILNYHFLDYLVLGLSASVLELIGDKYDNLTLPIGLSLISYLLI